MASDSKEDFQYNSDTNYDEAIMEQQKAIENEVVSSQNIISLPEDLSSLEKEYNADDAVYLAKIQHLKGKYSKIRRARGDGNCFYRAYGFAMFEQLIGDTAECQRIKGIAEKTKEFLVSVGYQDLTVSDFLEFFVDLVTKAESGLDAGELLATFNDQSSSDYLIVFLRLIVSAELQREADFYSCFIEDGKTVKEFCSLEVEPMARESDHIHMTALASTLKIPIRIEYMDRSKFSDAPNHHDFPEGAEPRLVFLYRPGHYDILYKSKA